MSYQDLGGKRVVITGGVSGIGLATAKRFLVEGAKVVLIDKDKEGLEEVLKNNPELEGGIQADVGKENEVEQGFERVDEIMGGLDVLISNAGVSVRKPFLDITYDQWRTVHNVNLDGMFLCSQQALLRMKEQQNGVILYTASNNGIHPHPLYADYNSSKAAVMLLAKTLALEFAPWLRINAVCPGYVLTPMQKAEYTEEMIEQVNQDIPLGRHAQPEEIANLFAFLTSSESAYITGQCIPIDGGETV